MSHGPGGLLGELLRIDTDREYRGTGPAIARDDDAVANDGVQLGLHIGQEILAIFFGLETDQVIGQHRLDQVAVMRHAADHGTRRPRRVQEEADRLRDAELAQLRAKREKMIVLNPEHDVRLPEAQQRTRHEGVDFAIAEIVVLGGTDQIGAGMQRRP
jgi:hypothetical protein